MGHRRNNSHSRGLEPQAPVPSTTARRAILAAPLIAAIGAAAASPASARTTGPKTHVTSINGKTGEVLLAESTDASTAALIENPESRTRAALSAAVAEDSAAANPAEPAPDGAGEMGLLDVDDWVGRVGVRQSVPTPDPVSNAGQAVHPSVLYFPDRWNGFRYWMGVTPYAGGRDKYEDPCILASADGNAWVVPAGLKEPLDNAPGRRKYNSDPYLAFHEGKLHLFWRYLDKTSTGSEESLFVRTSTDGVKWSAKVKIYGSDKKVRRLVAPSFQHINGTWHMWAVDIVPKNKPLVHLTSTSLTGAWSPPAVCSVPVRSGRTPWHVHIKRRGDQYVGLMNDTVAGGKRGKKGDLYLITSNDGETWVSSAKVIIPRRGPHHNKLYAATFVYNAQGFDVWYSGRLSKPTVWSVLRTRLKQRDSGTPYATLAGSATLANIPAQGGSGEKKITFPPGLFTKTPSITATSGNGRINPGTHGVSKRGFTLTCFNWTAGAVNKTKVQWIATQMSD